MIGRRVAPDPREEDRHAIAGAAVVRRAAGRLDEVTTKEPVDRIAPALDHEAEDLGVASHVRGAPHLPAPAIDVLGKVLGDHDGRDVGGVAFG